MKSHTARPVGLLLGSSNPHPSHWTLSFPLNPPPTNPIHVLWTLSSSSNSDHPPNPNNPDGGLKFVNLNPLESTYNNREIVSLLSRMDSTHTYFFFYLILNPNKNRTFYLNFKLKIILINRF